MGVKLNSSSMPVRVSWNMQMKLFQFLSQGPFVELYNCTGTRYKDTCEVRCDENFNKTVSRVQCGSDGKWRNLTEGEFFCFQEYSICDDWLCKLECSEYPCKLDGY